MIRIDRFKCAQYFRAQLVESYAPVRCQIHRWNYAQQVSTNRQYPRLFSWRGERRDSLPTRIPLVA
jgi:hypothetical protein